MSGASVLGLAEQPAASSRASARWGDLGVRALSAAVLAPAAMVCIWVGGIVFNLMVGAVAAGLALEWVLLLGPRRRFNWLLPLGIAYVAVAGASLAWLRADPDAGRANLLLLVSIVWASDIGAYVTGRLAGGPRLAPAISPGKTWSGAIGGLLSAVAVGAIASLLLDQAGRLPVACLVAACLSIVGQCGDLLESWVKRRLGVKDSGRLIPGHGGLFDRLDALLAAAPAAALLALIAGRAVILWG